MCGIYAVSGVKNAANQVLAGLKRLEYRGYDSWGVATVSNQEIKLEKRTGKISQVKKVALPMSSVAVGHTRWATHGGVTQKNAHPHLASDRSFALAQNGIVQNFSDLKKKLLKKGATFISETDTEVIVRLIEEERKTTSNLFQATQKAFKKIQGRNTIILITTDGQIIATRNGSPLVVGFPEFGDSIFISSDTLSFANQVTKVVIIDNSQMISIKDGKFELIALKNGQRLPVKKATIDVVSEDVSKEGFNHFMIKEINESSMVIRQVLNQPLDRLKAVATKLKEARTVYTIGSGTAGVAASQIAYYLRRYAGITSQSLVGADAVEYLSLITPEDMIVAPSQSGETADVLEILEQLKKQRVPIVSYVNMQGASMTRLADYPFLAQAGPEVSVMSTKIFVSQIAWGYLLAKTVAGETTAAQKNLANAATVIEKMLAQKTFHRRIKKLANLLKLEKNIFLLAKGQNLNIIKEGMIKMIEGSYKHAHAIPAGDLKHYAITLMESGVSVLAVMSNDEVFSDVMNAAHEVQAREATIIGIGPKSRPEFDYFLTVPDTGETSGLVNVIPLQVLAYELAVLLGHDVDHPRNIAKSVTVK